VTSARLRLTRDVGMPPELQRGRFEITVDGKNLGSVENHQTVEIPIESGRHTIRIRKGRYSSRDHSFEVSDGEVIDFQCHGARIWPTYVASLIKPDLGISLKQE